MRFRRSLVLEVDVAVTFHTVLLFSVFLLFAGHNAPGGGFIGGLVAGAAFMLRYISGGALEVEQAGRVSPEVLLGTGVTVSVATGIASLVLGADFLESGYRAFDLPVLGEVSLTSVLAFDIGVYLVVIGLVTGILRSLGQEESEGEPTALPQPLDRGAGGGDGLP